MTLEDRIVYNVRKLQRDKNLTQQDLANVLFCSKENVQKKNVKKYKYSINDIEALCNYFNLPYDYFFRDTEPIPTYVVYNPRKVEK